MITCSERCDSTTRRSDQWLVFIRALHLCENASRRMGVCEF